MYLKPVIEKLKENDALVATNVVYPLGEYITYQVGELYKNGDTIIGKEEIYSLPSYGWVVCSLDELKKMTSMEIFASAMYGIHQLKDETCYTISESEVSKRLGSTTPTGKDLKGFVEGMHQQYDIDGPYNDAEAIYWLHDNGCRVFANA